MSVMENIIAQANADTIESITEIAVRKWDQPLDAYNEIVQTLVSGGRMKHPTTRIETQVWEPDTEPGREGYLKLIRTKTINEVWSELHAIIGDYPLGADEHFGPSVVSRNPGQLWPVDARIACFVVEGSSEGDWIHIDAHHPDGTYENIFLGKTFDGWDNAWALCRRVAYILNVY